LRRHKPEHGYGLSLIDDDKFPLLKPFFAIPLHPRPAPGLETHANVVDRGVDLGEVAALSDDGGHAIIVARLNSFAAACGAYGRLVEDRPADFTCSPFFSR